MWNWSIQTWSHLDGVSDMADLLTKAGVTITRVGHVRFTSPRELRGEYVHRHIVRKLIEETPYSIRLLLPNPYEVHHMNFNKQDNAPSNFIILAIDMHSAQTADGRRREHGRFIPKFKPCPWLPLYDDTDVPF